MPATVYWGRALSACDRMVNHGYFTDEADAVTCPACILALARNTIERIPQAVAQDERPTLTCPHCNGTGLVVQSLAPGLSLIGVTSAKCPHCDGEGSTVF